ncbi:MAG: hypothetical protein GC179_25755 [Anaerolineaceae bacterium]|nr:hypothetical protein [Anaerolineaceae bacterium]
MGIVVSWENPEKTILRQKFDGKWTGAEYYASLDEINKLLKEVDYRVHWIGDMTDSVGIPALNLLAASGRVVKMVEHQFLTVSVVKAHNYFQSLVNVVRRMSPALAERVFFVNTLDEAYSLLATRFDVTAKAS